MTYNYKNKGPALVYSNLKLETWIVALIQCAGCHTKKEIITSKRLTEMGISCAITADSGILLPDPYLIVGFNIQGTNLH